MSLGIADRTFQLLTNKTTPSGKLLYRCALCGYETPAPSKNHACDEHMSWGCEKCWRSITEAEAANYNGMCRGCFEDAGQP